MGLQVLVHIIQVCMICIYNNIVLHLYTKKNHYRKGGLLVMGLYREVQFLLYVSYVVKYNIYRTALGSLVSSIFPDIPFPLHII